jgi:hypothetical protein
MSAPTPKPELAIDIHTIKRTRKRIEINWTQGEAKFGLKERDNPLQSFNLALDALAPLVSTICHLPDDYAKTNLRVVGVVMSEQGGTEMVSIIARKGLDDASKEFLFTTPARLLAHPTEPGSYTPPLSNAEAAAVFEVLEQAKLYIRGERAQGQIAFEGDDDEEGEEDANDPLPFETPEAAGEKPAEEKPKRTRKAKAQEPVGVH